MVVVVWYAAVVVIVALGMFVALSKHISPGPLGMLAVAGIVVPLWMAIDREPPPLVALITAVAALGAMAMAWRWWRARR